jgi:aryl-alcohol dehydrogenase-like predicted oxidoreductase
MYWGSLRRAGLRDAIRNLASTERDKLVVAVQTYDHYGFMMRRFVEKGLRALRLDYADVLILGWHRKAPSKGVLEAASRLRDQGKVHFIAMSAHRRPLFAAVAAKTDSPIDVFMIRYNAAHRGAETDVFPHLPAKNRPGITTYTATRWGQLLKTRRMPSGETPLTAAECYRFALSNPNVDLCMTGPANTQQMEEALRALDDGPMSEEELARCRRIGDYVHG